ncbi:hypothetical protein FRB98_002813 [Tulasnella sp. 332]|nr:hypothetical protein FRB98_002813 [Tulasnella sp. 332]
MTSFYPLLELISPLEYRGSAWEFASELSDVDWERFGRYSGYIRYINYAQSDRYRGHHGLPSSRALADILLHRPSSDGSMFPNLTEVHWRVFTGNALMNLLLFLVPTVTNLQILCKGPLEDACITVLKVLAPRSILLLELRIAMELYTQAFLEGLPSVLANQCQLIRLGLPHHSASQQVVTALAALPSLEEYSLLSLIEYQAPREIGMDFDWEQGAFPALKTLALVKPLADAARVMSGPHRPQLSSLYVFSQDFSHNTDVGDLCSSLSNSQPRLTLLALNLYSDPEAMDHSSSQAIPFDLIRPLLQCTTLREFYIRSNMAMAYNDEDIESMAGAWPNLKTLALCADPASDVGLITGQPLRSIGNFIQSFHMLRSLSIYLNTLGDEVEPKGSLDSTQPRLSVLNLGTSPIPSNSTAPVILSASAYLAALLENEGEIRSERSGSHKRFFPTSETAEEEFSDRTKFWLRIATNVKMIQAGEKLPTKEVALK